MLFNAIQSPKCMLCTAYTLGDQHYQMAYGMSSLLLLLCSMRPMYTVMII